MEVCLPNMYVYKQIGWIAICYFIYRDFYCMALLAQAKLCWQRRLPPKSPIDSCAYRRRICSLNGLARASKSSAFCFTWLVLLNCRRSKTLFVFEKKNERIFVIHKFKIETIVETIVDLSHL